MRRCYELLRQTSRSFAAVIQALDDDLRYALLHQTAYRSQILTVYLPNLIIMVINNIIVSVQNVRV